MATQPAPPRHSEGQGTQSWLGHYSLALAFNMLGGVQKGPSVATPPQFSAAVPCTALALTLQLQF